jgi:protein-tyrosine phosphatase
VTPALPPPRNTDRYSVALVCLGNICRSPMADVVLQQHLADAGLDGRVTVASSGTGDWHIGHPMDRRAAATLTTAGYDATRHRAQQFGPTWLDEHDLVLAMDAQNLRDVVSDAEVDPSRVRLYRDFDPREPGGEVPDPYYGGDKGFEEVLEMVERTSAALVAALAALLERQPGPA